MELKKLKVATSRMAGYTGVLGPVRFKDGVSEEYLPRHIRDRMAASMEFVEIDSEGNEQPAGPQYRLIAENRQRAPQMDPLSRQSEVDKTKELASAAVVSAKVLVLETRESLEAIAEKLGIAGVREVAAKWGVKHRSIPVLIEMILDSQEKSVAARNKRLAEQAGETPAAVITPAAVVEQAIENQSDPKDATNEVAENATKTVPDAEPVGFDPDAVSEKTAAAADALNEKLKAAAATGDLSAALNTQE